MDQPVSRRHEHDYCSYYGYPSYWGFGGVWGMGAYPQYQSGEPLQATLDRASESGDQHLRSARELRGYHIQGSDDSRPCGGLVGGRRVLAGSASVDCDEQLVARQTIKNSPEWTSRTPVRSRLRDPLASALRPGALLGAFKPSRAHCRCRFASGNNAEALTCWNSPPCITMSTHGR